MCKQECRCYEIKDKINKDFPKSDWNLDEACDAWHERSKDLKNNHIKFEPYSDECYGCTCPTCGRMICGWCV
jgi:hypothetical protein